MVSHPRRSRKRTAVRTVVVSGAGSRRGPRAFWALLVAVLWHGAAEHVAGRAVADEQPVGREEAGPEDGIGDGDDRGISLPSDRGRERQLDRARRLVAAGSWSDAATALDEIVAGDRDVFVKRAEAAPANGTATIASIKSEAARLIAALPKAGREAYEAQFRGQAERALADAVAGNDADGIVTVARRWTSTAAGRRAALLAAVQALEAGQPLVAAAWLDRLAAADAARGLEPTLSVMRAVAWRQAGDITTATAILERMRNAAPGGVRIAGRDVPLSFSTGEAARWLDELLGAVTGSGAVEGDWRQPRGTATRNGIASASRPLLAARFRVPVTRHPAEGRLLEGRRQAFADQDVPLLPAALPVAVDGMILLRTPGGLLAVDFVTGKRTWLQPGAAGGDEGDDSDDQARGRLPRVFDNLTEGGLASDGRLVFAIDSHPDAFLSGGATAFGPLLRRGTKWQGGNTLSAYEVRGRGRLRWRLPAAMPAAGAATSMAWFMGAPLVVGDRLFVMVEERSEVRLDVLRAADGAVEWSQPLADVDEAQAIRSGEFRSRQLAGLSPALGGGVLVCPLGNGTVVAIDLATRELRWAHEYRRSPREAPPRPEGGIRGRLPGRAGFATPARGDTPADADRWRDEGPIVAGDRVLLTPHDADELICLDLRDGVVRWTLPRDHRLLTLAGVVGDRVIVVGTRDVEAVDLATGRGLWKCPFGVDGAAPSGRGVLTADRLFLPLDVPEVIEIGLADGTIVSRSPARGGVVPGNLVAYRGEMIALGTESLDVFHQVAALEPRVETAARSQPDDAWAAHWRGQLDIDRGRVAAGLGSLLRADQLAPGSLPPDAMASALAAATARDFAAAGPAWKAFADRAGTGATAQAALRNVVDCFLRADDRSAAWEVCRELLAADEAAAAGLTTDGADRPVRLTDRAWFHGRLARLRAGAAPALGTEIDARLAAAVADADAIAEPAERLRRLDLLAARFSALPAGLAARQRIALDGPASGRASGGDGVDPVRRDLWLLELARGGNAGQRAQATGALEAARREDGPEAGLDAWPLGRVKQQRPPIDRRARAEDARSRPLTLPVEATPRSLLPGLSLAYDPQASRIWFLDGYGRPLGEPLAVDRPDVGPLLTAAQAAAIEAVSQGRVVFVRSAATVSAFAIGDAAGNRRLWTTAVSAARSGQPPVALRLRQPLAGLHRQGEIPLGERITEPGDAFAVAGSTIWCGPRTSGVPIYESRALTILDPASGAVLWERHRLPPANELLADEEVVCVCTPSGRGSLVLSMADGRVLREVDLPDRRSRLLTAGRLLLAIAPGPAADDARQQERVVLEVWDVAAGTRRPLAEFSGMARARSAGPGRLAVVEPAGQLTLLDLSRQAVAFTTTLPDMPDRCDVLQVVPWMDRLLVLVGRRDDGGAGQPDQASIIPLQQTMLAGHDGQMVSYSIWSVDASSGARLWDVPATVAHHCLHPVQPASLPLLLFCRQIQGTTARDTTQLSVLCLDKRTGHAVFEDDRIRVQPHLLHGCEMTGDPMAHTITVRSRGGDAQEVVLRFTGEPLAPRPPHQSAARPPRPIDNWDAWLEKALRLPER